LPRSFALFCTLLQKSAAQPAQFQSLAASLQKPGDDVQSAPQNQRKPSSTKGSLKMNPTIDQSTAPSTNPSATTPPFGQTSARCIHRTPSGRRCSAEAIDPQASFCRRHLFGSTRRYPDPSLASELLGDLTEFDSAAEVNQFLSRLLLLLAQDRVSPRRAAVMAYTCNLILHSHRAIDIDNKIAANAPQEIVWDLVRPKRDD
jgi:hypothetical protein